MWAVLIEGSDRQQESGASGDVSSHLRPWKSVDAKAFIRVVVRVGLVHRGLA